MARAGAAPERTILHPALMEKPRPGLMLSPAASPVAVMLAQARMSRCALSVRVAPVVQLTEAKTKMSPFSLQPLPPVLVMRMTLVPEPSRAWISETFTTAAQRSVGVQMSGDPPDQAPFALGAVLMVTS